MMRAGCPHLLAVDHPAVALELGAGHCAREIGARAWLAEQLAPGILASQAAAQPFFLLRLVAVHQKSCGRQPADAGLRDADGADTPQLFLDYHLERHRQLAAEPVLWPRGHAPARVDQLVAPFHQAVVWAPVRLQPGTRL